MNLIRKINENFSSKLKVFLVNIFVLSCFLTGIEFFHRLIVFSHDCILYSYCKTYMFSLFPIDQRGGGVFGLTIYDENLGYVPKPGISVVVDRPTWNNSLVTHTEKGFRQSTRAINNRKIALTVGDSFAYGFQVPDGSTWQSCLNQKIDGIAFTNGGVPGYGTAQSVLRAAQIYSKENYDYLIVQTLVGRDLERDRYKSAFGLARPYFTKADKTSELILNMPIDKNYPNTKYGPIKAELLDYVFINFTFLERIGPLRKAWRKTEDKLRGEAWIISENPAPVEDILDWSIKKSMSINPSVIWLLQYGHTINEIISKERDLILTKLNKYKVNFIDTHDVLHSNKASKQTNKKLWNGHHTAEGNEVVCNEIVNHFVANDLIE